MGEAHPDSFPPIIINITDGLVTDSPYRGAGLYDWSERLTGITTTGRAGSAVQHLPGPRRAPPVMFPATDRGPARAGPGPVPDQQRAPPPMVANAHSTAIPVGPGARGFGFNADALNLVRFLEVGTKVDVRTDPQRHADPGGDLQRGPRTVTRPMNGRTAQAAGVAGDVTGAARFIVVDGATHSSPHAAALGGPAGDVLRAPTGCEAGAGPRRGHGLSPPR